jgi:hypothetical protein
VAIGWLLTVLFLAVVTVVFYFLLVAKTNNLLQALDDQANNDQANANADMNTAIALVYIIIILIILFNKLLMGWVLHYFAHL